jgi:hypothetical protein
MDIVGEAAIVVVIKDTILEEDITATVVIKGTTISQMIQITITTMMEIADIAIIQIIQSKIVIKRCGQINSATTRTMAMSTATPAMAMAMATGTFV